MAYGRCYNRYKYLCMTGGVNLTSGTVKVMLMKTTYTFNPDHNVVADISSHEVSGTNYARQTVSGKTVTQDNTNDRAVYTNDAVVFNNITVGTFNGAVLYVHVTNDNDSPLIAYYNFDTQTASASNVTLTPSVNEGMVQIL